MRPSVLGWGALTLLGVGALIVIGGLGVMMNPTQRRGSLMFILLPIAIAITGYVIYCTLSPPSECKLL